MTLCTHIAIGKPHPVDEIFEYCRRLLNTPSDTPRERGGDLRRQTIHNPCGIGLDAWLWIYYSVDGPMIHQHNKYCPVKVDDDYGSTKEDVDEHAQEMADDPTENGWAFIDVTFDTAYGHRNTLGENCSQIHAGLVLKLGRWLDRKGLPWKWKNEYTGEWFDGYNGLAEFVGAHKTTGAEDWFNAVFARICAPPGPTAKR